LWVAETNPEAADVLKRVHPEAVNVGDITVPERFLWPDVMRLIERVRPREVFLENVQSVTSVPLFPGADTGTVLKLRLDDLWRGGYEVRWTVLGACAVGAPHHRHRWFLRARWFGLGAPAPRRATSRSSSTFAPTEPGR